MVSTFTPNIQLEEPARGDDVGTWDTPVNSNMTLVDKVAGAITTISLNNSPVVLSAAQFQSKQITFNSTLTGSVAITFPTSFTKSYEIQNVCTGSSTFVITLTTTATGGQSICCPPGETIDCFNDGANLKYKNLGRVGSYWDYAGSSVPAWVSGCTVAPYLNCDGTTFVAATFPALAVILGGNTLPDSKGRGRAALNQGTGRITSSQGGVDGNTILAAGGLQAATLSASNHAPHFHVLTVLPATLFPGVVNVQAPGGVGVLQAANTGSPNSDSQGSASPFTIMQPTYIGGLTLIRSA